MKGVIARARKLSFKELREAFKEFLGKVPLVAVYIKDAVLPGRLVNIRRKSSHTHNNG
ncbi:MAG: hypothetical protein FWF23_02665 [Alphaproteobacteria bacterium]|nr:hypothetical protein [Alphaproteobacteria bacterium]MCL2505521.1 hypothetical protein [Alphaproteobacteria bacterium]